MNQDLLSVKSNTKSSFSIDCLLGKKTTDHDFEIDDNDDDIDDLDLELEDTDKVVKPQPRLAFENETAAAAGDDAALGGHGPSENPKDPEEEAAITAALQSSLFYSQHPSNFLYSQWLASRNTSALFGLQGEIFFSSSIF